MALHGLAALNLLACSETRPSEIDPSRYRLTESGRGWRSAGDDAVLRDLRRRYPAFFGVVLDASRSEEPDILPLRNDLENEAAGRKRYDALNAVAIGYFELNARAQEAVGNEGGGSYLADSFRATKLLAVPWRAYGEVDDPAVRDAILAFFEDVGAARKRGTGRTAPRIIALVASLAEKEDDPGRLARLVRLEKRLVALRRQIEADDARRASAAERRPRTMRR